MLAGLLSLETVLAGQLLPPRAPSHLRILRSSESFPHPSWIQISAGTSIQTVVDRYPGATAFYLKAGIHRRQTIRPKDDNRFIGELGAVLDGEGVTQYAFETLNHHPQRVTLQRLVIQNTFHPYSGAPFKAITRTPGSSRQRDPRQRLCRVADGTWHDRPPQSHLPQRPERHRWL